MNVVLSFIGKLPEYTITCIQQIRTFYYGHIYLITNELDSKYMKIIKESNVTIINYEDVIHEEFNRVSTKNYSKFTIVNGLTGREELFIRSFERFFILYNLMKLKNLENCFFMEIDNLIYDNPNNWLEEFSKNDLCYMYDNKDRCSSGVMYIKNNDSLIGFLDHILDFIETSTEFLSEMTCLARYYETNKSNIQLLPVYWPKQNMDEKAYLSFGKYGNTIFDAASIGIYLLGTEPFHTGGVVLYNQKNMWSAMDYSQDKFEWKIDENGRRRPYILKDDEWILINNLHVHSKELKNGLSI